MAALRIGDTILRFTQTQRQLSAENGFYAVILGCLCHLYDAVEAVVIGKSKSMQPKTRRLLQQCLGGACPVKEAVVGVGVELRIRDCRDVGARDLDGDIRHPLGRPCGTITTVSPYGRGTGAAVVR